MFLLAFVKRCAVTLAALGSQSRRPTTPSRPDAPTKLNSVADQILPTRPASYTGPLMTVDLERIARADLKEMGDIRIDDVLSFIDRGIEHMPSYMDLYRRWEAQQWAVGDLDFSLDRQDWLDSSDLAMLYHGPFPPEFYRVLHTVVHREFRMRRAARAVVTALRRPASLRPVHLKRAASIALATAALSSSR